MQTNPNKVLDSVVRWMMHLSQLRKYPVFKCDQVSRDFLLGIIIPFYQSYHSKFFHLRVMKYHGNSCYRKVEHIKKMEISVCFCFFFVCFFLRKKQDASRGKCKQIKIIQVNDPKPRMQLKSKHVLSQRKRNQNKKLGTLENSGHRLNITGSMPNY